MKRCVAGGIVRSCVAMRYREGTDRHAGAPDGSLVAAAANGRCVAHIAAATRTREVAGESGEVAGLREVEVDALGVPVRIGPRDERLRSDEAAGVAAIEVVDGLALVGHEGRDVDERLDVRDARGRVR